MQLIDTDMYFYSIKDKLPKDKQIVLIKEKESYSRYTNELLNPEKYYVCTFNSVDSVFVEASGELYYYWCINDVIGWMPIEKLDNISILKSI